MIEIERASPEDAVAFAAMEQAADTKDYILPHSPAEHLRKMLDPDTIYLRIVNEGALTGFFILALDPDGISVEFRRIVVSVKGLRVGQSAIPLMEQFCRSKLKRLRIWLDVFVDNDRGRHIYEKLGYQKYGETAIGDRHLLLYQKRL